MSSPKEAKVEQHIVYYKSRLLPFHLEDQVPEELKKQSRTDIFLWQLQDQKIDS